jgi:hypothetical protein
MCIRISDIGRGLTDLPKANFTIRARGRWSRVFLASPHQRPYGPGPWLRHRSTANAFPPVFISAKFALRELLRKRSRVALCSGNVFFFPSPVGQSLNSPNPPCNPRTSKTPSLTKPITARTSSWPQGCFRMEKSTKPSGRKSSSAAACLRFLAKPSPSPSHPVVAAGSPHESTIIRRQPLSRGH